MMEITSRINGTLGLGKILGRKRTALYRIRGCSFYPIAYIDHDDDAVWLESFLFTLCGAAGAEDADQVPSARKMDDIKVDNPNWTLNVPGEVALEFERLHTVEAALIELETHLPSVCQLLDGLRQKLPASAWTEWDQSVCDKLSEHISKRTEWPAASTVTQGGYQPKPSVGPTKHPPRKP